MDARGGRLLRAARDQAARLCATADGGQILVTRRYLLTAAADAPVMLPLGPQLKAA
jgi:hypothetical protein